jgi:hypothetical protein
MASSDAKQQQRPEQALEVISSFLQWLLASEKFGWCQGDQIGQFFTNWATFGSFGLSN